LAETSGSFSPRIIDSLLNAVVIVDSAGRVLYANQATEEFLGWPVTSLFGEPVVDLVPERFRSRYARAFERLVRTDPPRPSYAPGRIVMLRADHTEAPVEIGAFLVVPEVGQRLLIAVLWDVSDRIDIDRYQRVSDELVSFLAGASGTTADIVPQLLSIVASSMDFELATAWRWEEGSGTLQCEHIWQKDEAVGGALATAYMGTTIRAGEGLAGLVVRSNEPVWQLDLASTGPEPHLEAIVSGGMHTGFAFPIRARQRLVGVIELFTAFPRRPDAPLNAAVADIGAELGEFIERLELETQRSELIDRLERSQRHQEFLLRANRALAGARNFKDAVERLATVALPTLGDICLIDVVDATGSLERLAAVHVDPVHQADTDELRRFSPDREGSHPAARAVRTGQSQWSTDMGDEFMRSTTQGDRHFTLTRKLSFESYVSVPLLMEGGPIGALTVIIAGSGRQFGPEELALAETLASQVTSVIERARALEEQSTISHHLQHSLLPGRLGQMPGIDVAARYVAASKVAEVGGDFYDVVDLDGRRLALVIGDVEGHDMTAATVMGELRSALRAYLLITHDPAEVLGMVDRFALTQPHERLTTTCLAVIDSVEHTMSIATAGHPAPFVVFDGSRAVSLRVPAGRPLGVGGGQYVRERVDLPSSGQMVFFTDGLIDEGRSDAGARIATLTTLLERNGPRHPDVLADAILDALTASQPGIDDLAVLVVQWSWQTNAMTQRTPLGRN
jgi:PAS domain S-box-containing protein